MGLGQLLIPTLVGYWLLTTCYQTRYKIRREQGYHVVFRSAVVGLVLFFIAHFIAEWTNHLYPQLCVAWKKFMPFGYSPTTMLTIILGLIYPPISNQFCTKEEAALIAAKEAGSLIEPLLDKAVERGMTVEISLKNRKSYIGYVIQNDVIGAIRADIAVVPIWSGYRQQDTNELEITTDYSSVVFGYINRDRLEDFKIILPLSEVVSARLFDPAVYDLFQSQSAVQGPGRQPFVP